MNANCPKCGGPIPPEAPQGLCPRCLLAGVSVSTDAGKEPAALPPRDELVAAFPQLEILELIGQGGMGFVFKARQPKLDRFVALKILPQSLAADAAFAERFTREGRVLARLNHPSIVTVHDFGQANGFFYLLMEFVDGVNLRQAMRAGRFNPDQALAIVPKICEALQYAHNEGILHRDIKPENILLDTKGRVKIADFGIAKLLAEVQAEAHLTGSGATLGTPHYMAPEQIEKPATVDHRADIYSLGVVFYEMLTGELPLGRFAPPSEKSAADPRLDDVVFRALEKEPSRRPQSAGEVKTVVETIAGQNPAARAERTASQPVSASLDWPRLVRRGVVVGAVTLLMAFVVTVAVAALLPKKFAASARVSWNAPLVDRVTGRIENGFISDEMMRMTSQSVLSQTVLDLGLHTRWGVREEEAVLRLREGLVIAHPQRSRLVDIRFFSKDREEARSVANRVLEVYCAQVPAAKPIIVERASYPTHAARPNRTLILVVGGFISGTLAVLAATLSVFVLARRLRAKIGEATVQKIEHRPSRTAFLALGLFLAGTLGTLMLMTVSSRHTMALIFGGTALTLALIFGLMSRRERFGKGVVIAAAVLVIGLGLTAAVLVGGFLLLERKTVTEAHRQEANAREQVTAAVKEEANHLAQEGWRLWNEQRLDEAVDKFRRAVEVAPENANTWNGLGWASFNSGLADEAEKAFQKAVALVPGHPGALNGLGQIYLSQGKYELAETNLLKSAATQAPAAWHGLARLYLIQGKFEQAEAWAEKVISSGQADDLARQMLEAAREKQLGEQLRSLIEPPLSGAQVAQVTTQVARPLISGATNVSGLKPVPTTNAMRALAKRICEGDQSAFDELRGIATLLYAGINYTTERDRVMTNLYLMRAAFDELGEQAGRTNDHAFSVLQSSVFERHLKGAAIHALGIAAAAGHEPSMDMLLNHRDWNLLFSSTVFAMRAPAAKGDDRAVDFLVEVLENQSHRPLWSAAAQGLRPPAEKGNARARAALERYEQTKPK